MKKLSLIAGLRWQNEHNDYETNGRKNAEQSPDYHVLIPRLSLTYRTERWTNTLSYQCFRRNPAYSTLSTAINYRSKYEYQTGNPYLRPTTTHYVSWTTNYRWIRAELYYQYIKNLNYSFLVAYDDTDHPGVILDDRRNVPKSQNYGLEINVTPKIGIWQMNYSADFYFNNRDLEAIGIKHKWNGLGTYFNLDNTLSLPRDWLLNIKMELTPYNEQGCSQTKTTGGINLRLSRQLLKDKSLSIAVLANDIFHTRYIEMTAYGGINVRTQFKEYRDGRRIGIRPKIELQHDACALIAGRRSDLLDVGNGGQGILDRFDDFLLHGVRARPRIFDRNRDKGRIEGRQELHANAVVAVHAEHHKEQDNHRDAHRTIDGKTRQIHCHPSTLSSTSTLVPVCNLS